MRFALVNNALQEAQPGLSAKCRCCGKARMLSWIQSDRENSGGSLGEWVFSLLRKHPSEAMTKIPSQVTSRIADINKNKSPSTLELFACKTGSDKKVFSIDKSYLVDLVPAKTAGAFQRNWYTPNEFPCCPHENKAEPIKAYAEKIVPGAIFSRNKYSTSIILESALVDTNKSILVMC
ncbi:TPA: hypothetical protein SJ233_003029 [Legionella pneumophila]|nr:hypothetical protein [Legionella pneumophila]